MYDAARLKAFSVCGGENKRKFLKNPALYELT